MTIIVDPSPRSKLNGRLRILSLVVLLLGILIVATAGSQLLRDIGAYMIVQFPIALVILVVVDPKGKK